MQLRSCRDDGGDCYRAQLAACNSILRSCRDDGGAINLLYRLCAGFVDSGVSGYHVELLNYSNKKAPTAAPKKKVSKPSLNRFSTRSMISCIVRKSKKRNVC